MKGEGALASASFLRGQGEDVHEIAPSIVLARIEATEQVGK
jgi:hypothetical protein